jgi:hypothetical protein
VRYISTLTVGRTQLLINSPKEEARQSMNAGGLLQVCGVRIFSRTRRVHVSCILYPQRLCNTQGSVGTPHYSTSSSLSASHHSNAPSVQLQPLPRTSRNGPYRNPSSGTFPASHAYQIRQLANGRAGWSAGIWIKDAACPNRDSFIAPITRGAHQARE